MNQKEFKKVLEKYRSDKAREIDLIDALLEHVKNENLNDSLESICSFWSKDNSLLWMKSLDNNCKSNNFKHQGSYSINTYLWNIDHLYPKSDDMTWKEYLMYILQQFDKEAKTSDIAKLIIQANRDLTFNKARQTAADILPELVKDNKVEVIKGDSRKEGNSYQLLK